MSKKWLVSEIDPTITSYLTDFKGVMARGSHIKNIHTKESSADTEAQELAVKNPGKQYAVFGILRVFETTQPKFVEKKFDERGQLVLADSGEKQGG